MKKVDLFLKEYVSKLSEDNLKYLYTRFSQRLAGDLAEAIDVLSTNIDLDRWLASAKSSNEFYDNIDIVARFVDREAERRWGK